MLYRLHKTDQQRLKPMHLEIKESKKYFVIVWKFEIVRKINWHEKISYHPPPPQRKKKKCSIKL